MIQSLSSSKPSDDLPLFFGALRRYDPRHRLAKHFLRAVAEQAPCTLVPTGDYPLEVFADDGVFGRCDDGGEPRLVLLRFFLLGDVKLVAKYGASARGNIRELNCSIPADRNRLTFFSGYRLFHHLLTGHLVLSATKLPVGDSARALRYLLATAVYYLNHKITSFQVSCNPVSGCKVLFVGIRSPTQL
jgi:hypothetical protein